MAEIASHSGNECQPPFSAPAKKGPQITVELYLIFNIKPYKVLKTRPPKSFPTT
jgi:hypothetical protein